MTRYVIDTNVPVITKLRDAHVSDSDRLKAARFLYQVMQSGVVLDDEEDLAVGEYRRYLDMSGQPSMGDVFFDWFMRERWLGNVVQRVASPTGSSLLSILPATLTSFDSDDHKWICLYIEGSADWIVNAVDSDWRNALAALESAGINVLEILDR